MFQDEHSVPAAVGFGPMPWVRSVPEYRTFQSQHSRQQLYVVPGQQLVSVVQVYSAFEPHAASSGTTDCMRQGVTSILCICLCHKPCNCCLLLSACCSLVLCPSTAQRCQSQQPATMPAKSQSAAATAAAQQTLQQQKNSSSWFKACMSN